MWNKSKTISGVIKYVVGENKTFAICGEGTPPDDELVSLPFRSHKGYNPIFLTYKSSVFYSTYENEICKFDGHSKVEEKIIGYSGSLASNFENVFITHPNLGTTIVDVETATIIQQLPFSLIGVVASKNFVIGKIGRKGREIIVIDIENNVSFEIPLLSKLYKTLNIQDKLILMLYDDGTVSCHDIGTGKQLWSLTLAHEIGSYSFSNLLYDKTNDSVFLLAHSFVFELAYLEKEIRSKKDFSQMGERHWYFKSSKIYDDLITFSGADVSGKFPMVAGVIDKNTKQILWSVNCEPGVYFEGAPQIKDDKLYILDSAKTLHIFEKGRTHDKGKKPKIDLSSFLISEGNKRAS